jgi:hypothetical protein
MRVAAEIRTVDETTQGGTMRLRRLGVALALGGTIAAGCGGDGVTSMDAASDPPATGEELYRADFADGSADWDVIDHPSGGTRFDGSDYVWEFEGEADVHPHLLATSLGEQFERGELDMLDVTVHAEATLDGANAAVGVFCRESPDRDADFQWYEFLVRDGFAAIRLADTEGNLEVLSETDDIAVGDGARFTIDAGCVDDEDGAHLTLVVDGRSLLEARLDDALGNGVPGLQAYYVAGEGTETTTELRWHELIIARPAAAEE